MDNVKSFLDELSAELMRKLGENEELVKRVVANLEVSVDEYKRVLVSEVMNDVCVEAVFAFPPLQDREPNVVRVKAVKLLESILARDERLFCRGGGSL